MTLLEGNDPEASRSLRVIREEEEEWRAYHSLHPSVRKMLQECPYEFSALDAEYLWNMCVGTIDSLGEFRYQLERNVENLRAAEARVGVGRDIRATQSLRKPMVEFSLPNSDVFKSRDDTQDPNAFSLY